jgi:hypothetical protein
LGGLDTDWTSFSEAITKLLLMVRNKDGVETVIKNLDGKLSEAIMHAMTNGPDLEKKVSHEQNNLSGRRGENDENVLMEEMLVGNSEKAWRKEGEALKVKREVWVK